MGLIDKFRAMSFAKKVALCIVLFYGLALPPMGAMSYLFMKNTVLSLEPNADSLVGMSQSLAMANFHSGQVYIRPFAMMCVNHNTSASIVENPEFKTFSDLIYNAVYAALPANASSDPINLGNGSLVYLVESYDGYFTFPDYVSFLRSRVLGGDHNQTTVIQLEIRGDVDMNDAVDSLVDWVGAYVKAYNPTFTVETTSVSQVFEDLQAGIVGDLLKVDAVSVPISVIVLVICVGSVRMINIAGLLVPMVLAFSFGLFYPISYGITISSLAPEMSAAVLLAISVDYSLFFATRFVDEVARMQRIVGLGNPLSEDDKYTVVYRTTTLTAHNVLVSGLTIAISLAGISLLPADFIRAIGMVFAIASVMAVIVSMTLIPSVLLVFFDYFAVPGNVNMETFRLVVAKAKEKLCCCLINKNNQHDKSDTREYVALPSSHADNESAANGDDLRSDAGAAGVCSGRDYDDNLCKPSNEESRLLATNESNNNSPSSGSKGAKTAAASINRNSYNVEDSITRDSAIVMSGDNDDLKETLAAEKEAYTANALSEMRASPWFKAATFAVYHPYITLLLLFAGATPFFYYATTIRTDFVIANQVPRGAPHVKILNEVQEQVGQGNAFPFTAVFIGHEAGDVMTERFFNKTYEFMERIHKACDQPLDSALSYAYVDGLGPMSYDLANFMLNNTAWFPGAAAYSFLFNKTVSEDRKSGIVQFSPTFNPFGTEAYSYLNKFSDVIDEFSAENKDLFSYVGVVGSSAISWQIMTDVLGKFPMQIGITFAIIFVLIACTFRSVFIPIRMLVTVAYTVAVAFGAGCIVFQHEWIWAVWPGMRNVTAYSWTCPIFSFSLLCALALDYDIFLLTRVVEMKQLGFNDKAAVIKAVYKTGRIISFAGVIMAVAFGALMFASVVLLNQYAFTAFVAVLVDTFIVRTFLVPALMCVVPSIVWWPRKFESADRDVDDMDF